MLVDEAGNSTFLQGLGTVTTLLHADLFLFFPQLKKLDVNNELFKHVATLLLYLVCAERDLGLWFQQTAILFPRTKLLTSTCGRKAFRPWFPSPAVALQWLGLGDPMLGIYCLGPVL